MTRLFCALMFKVILAVVLILRLLTSLLVLNIEDNLKECETNPTGRHIEFCGWELGESYSKQTVYDCYNKTPELHTDCTNAKDIIRDPILPPHYCRRYKKTTDERGCYAVWACTPQRDFCGLQDLEEVRNIINFSLPVPYLRKNRLATLSNVSKRVCNFITVLIAYFYSKGESSLTVSSLKQIIRLWI